MAATVISRLLNETAEFAQFLAIPSRERQVFSGGDNKLMRFLILLGLVLLIDLLSFYPKTYVESHAHIVAKVATIDTLQLYILIPLMMSIPLIEELLFRAGLRSAKYTLFIGPVVILAFTNHRPAAGVVGLISALILLFGVLTDRFSLFRNVAERRLRLGRKFISSYPWVFWAYAAAFALSHIGNYQYPPEARPLLIFSILPQFFFALTAGYVRLRDGLASAITLHYLNNGLIFMTILLFHYRQK